MTCSQSFIAHQRNRMQGHNSVSPSKTGTTENYHKLLITPFEPVQQVSTTIKNKAYSICFSYKPRILVPDTLQMHFLEALHIFYQFPSMKFGTKAQGLDSGTTSCGRRRPHFQRNQSVQLSIFSLTI